MVHKILITTKLEYLYMYITQDTRQYCLNLKEKSYRNLYRVNTTSIASIYRQHHGIPYVCMYVCHNMLGTLPF